ncbi:uncharacterized protein BP01DRAFT_356965 [Aspergillus saccharolyticus JOP 1030-1]|uniref:Secreted protein n=1 Tax=Aspergillus saccharolyticus JOP 1030-1 TaxID=1450539 RepID=A0A318ZME4_9EURO|nr:hypothetical protein BP01DRAFT_356965 [Aspergillus saccharolyticus JOP 1030-1]PYH45050.1 hypothetical protein BP01DRAFT_356965 [Aspergillus saccharolyticus JOP 1030-1]
MAKAMPRVCVCLLCILMRRAELQKRTTKASAIRATLTYRLCSENSHRNLEPALPRLDRATLLFVSGTEGPM